MAFIPRWRGTGVFLGTELRMVLHDPLAIASSALVEGILLVFVWVLARDLLPFALLGSLVYSLFLIGQFILSEAAYIRIDHRLNEMYHASPPSPEAYFLGMASGLAVGFLPTTLVLFALTLVLVPTSLAGLGAVLLVLLAVWPAEWRALALVLPTSAGAALAGAAVGLQPLAAGELLLAGAALGLQAAGSFAFATWWARRSAREA